jgi:hypothetical protein
VNKTLLIFLLLITTITTFSQEKYTISGYIKDAKTGEVHIGARVFIKELTKGTVTNLYGFYSLTVTEGTYDVEFSFVGYEKITKSIALSQDLRENIELQPTLMKEVVIEGKANENTNSTQLGKIDLDVSRIKSLPAFMGEVDVLKTIQLLPGVQSGGEGNTGFYVRGGGPDQNLILLDGAPVYNA